MKALLIAIGAAAGVGIGVVTRPTILGMQLPMEILSSSHPMDAEPKSMLIQHLVMTGGIGLLVGIGLAVLVTALQKRSS